jgi:hypothetical protein
METVNCHFRCGYSAFFLKRQMTVFDDDEAALTMLRSLIASDSKNIDDHVSTLSLIDMCLNQ